MYLKKYNAAIFSFLVYKILHYAVIRYLIVFTYESFLPMYILELFKKFHFKFHSTIFVLGFLKT